MRQLNLSLNVSKPMAKKSSPRNFSDALEYLAGHQFDVSSSREGSATKAFQVRKYGCAAEIAAAADGTTLILARPGWVLAGAGEDERGAVSGGGYLRCTAVLTDLKGFSG